MSSQNTLDNYFGTQQTATGTFKRPRTDSIEDISNNDKTIHAGNNVGSMSRDDLFNMICGIFDNKMNNVATKEDINSIENELQELRNENKELRKEVDTQRLKIEELDDNQRKNNLIFRGLSLSKSTETNDLIAQLKQFCNKTLCLNKEVNIVNAFPINKTSKQSIIKVQFSSSADSHVVMSNAKKLKGSNISIQRDLSIASRGRRAKYYKIKTAILQNNKKSKIVIKNSYIAIDNELFFWDLNKNILLNQRGEDGVAILKDLFQIDVMECINETEPRAIPPETTNNSEGTRITD